MTAPLIAFSHIPKTGGLTWNYLLRRNYGIRHLDVIRRNGHPDYLADDLAFDLKVYPMAVSLAGHPLKPFVNYGIHDERLRWYTMLRNPIKRFISHYQHRVEKGNETLSFEDYVRRGHRDNYQVKWLVGDDNLEKAKQMLAEKCVAVGFVEEYDASLVLFADALGIIDTFNLHYEKAVNTENKGDVRRKIEDNMAYYEPMLIEANQLDIELYEFARREIWDKQVTAYGADRLKADIERLVHQTPEPPLDALNVTANRAYRNLIYRPVKRLHSYVPVAGEAR